MRKYYSNVIKLKDYDGYMDMITYYSIYCGGYHSKVLVNDPSLKVVILDLHNGNYSLKKTNYYEVLIAYDNKVYTAYDVICKVYTSLYTYFVLEYSKVNHKAFNDFILDCYCNIKEYSNKGSYYTSSDSMDIEFLYDKDIENIKKRLQATI